MKNFLSNLRFKSIVPGTIAIKVLRHFKWKFEIFQVFKKFRASHSIHKVKHNQRYFIGEFDLFNKLLTADLCILFSCTV